MRSQEEIFFHIDLYFQFESISVTLLSRFSFYFIFIVSEIRNVSKSSYTVEISIEKVYRVLKHHKI